MKLPKFTAENTLDKTRYAYRITESIERSTDSVVPSQIRGWQQAVLFRVFGPDGKPYHGAEVRFNGARCSTVNGMCQTYMTCDGKLKNIEVWTVYGIKRTSYWAPSSGSWPCDETKDFEFRY